MLASKKMGLGGGLRSHLGPGKRRQNFDFYNSYGFCCKGTYEKHLKECNV